MTVSAIRQLIADGDLDEAQRRLGARASEGQFGPDYRLLEADLLQKRGDARGAVDVLRDLTRELPDHLGAHVRLVRLLRQTGKLEEARELFLRHVWKSSYSLEEQDRLVNQLSSGADATAEPTLAFLDQLVEGEATRRAILIRRGTFLSRLNRAEEALAAFDRAATDIPLPAYAATTHFELLMASGRVAEAAETARRLMAAEPAETRHAEKLATAAAQEGRLDIAEETLAEAFRHRPGDWWLLFRLNRIAFAPEAIDRLFTILVENADRISDPRAAFQYALCCLEQGRMDEALPILDGIAGDASAGAMARPLAPALRWLQKAELRPSRLHENRQLDIRVVPCPDAEVALIVFSGMMARFGYLPLSLIDRFLAGYKAHVIYLNDTHNAAYLSGLPGLGNEAQTVAGLRAAAHDLGAGRIVTLGASLGGFGAARYGAKLKADAILSLAGPTLLDPTAHMVDTPQHVRAAFGRLHARYNLIDDLKAAPDTRIVYAYSAGRPQHRTQIQRLEVLPGLVARPVAGTDSSFTAMEAVGRGLLPGLLDDLGIARL